MSKDTIYRQDVINGVKTLHDVAWKNWHEPTLSPNVVLDMIRELPSAQPEIIYCRECKWKQGAECVRFAEVRPFPDDFCSRAKRRTDEQTD